MPGFSQPGPPEVRLGALLDATGQRILARLGAHERAYFEDHRRGQPTPTIGFGIALSYAPAR